MKATPLNREEIDAIRARLESNVVRWEDQGLHRESATEDMTRLLASVDLYEAEIGRRLRYIGAKPGESFDDALNRLMGHLTKMEVVVEQLRDIRGVVRPHTGEGTVAAVRRTLAQAEQDWTKAFVVGVARGAKAMRHLAATAAGDVLGEHAAPGSVPEKIKRAILALPPPELEPNECPLCGMVN